MTKAKISEYDAVASNNTDVNGVNIAEGCPPSGMNNMGREIMAALKRFQVGSDGDGVTVGGNLVVSGSSTLSTTSISSADINAGTIDGTAIGGSTPAAGSFTTLNTSGAVVFNDAGADVDFRVEGDTDANLLFVDASADNVGIGTSSPAYRLQINAAGGNGISLIGDTNNEASVLFGDSGSAVIGRLTYNNASDSMRLWTNGSERMRIDSSGNVGIGTSSPALAINANSRALSIYQNAANGAGIGLVSSNCTLNIVAGNDATFISNETSDPIIFRTNATERMRIDSGGEVYIAGTTDQGAYNLQVNGTGVWGQGAYVNGSDERMKQNIADLQDGLSVITQLRPVTYQYREEFSKDQSTQPGFIAQELQTVLDGKDYKDGVVPEGPEYLNVAYQNLIPILTKAIQELKAELDTVKAELATLKG